MNNQYEYVIEEETNVVRIKFANTNDVVIYQPTWPNEEPWGSVEEAETWAQARIAELLDPTQPDAPAGPGLDPIAKPVLEESQEPTE